MPKNYIAMTARRRPDGDEDLVFSFPAGKYDKSTLCRLFLTECKARITAEARQASDVQLDLYGENAGLVMRCVARLGGMERLDFELARAARTGTVGTMPDKLPDYRDTGSFGPTGWDVIHHGDRYPSDPDRYAAMLDKFFAGHADDNDLL